MTTEKTITRRKSIQLLGAATMLPVSGSLPVMALSPVKNGHRLYTYCLNMSTIRGQNLGFMTELEVAAAAGFRSVEIWMDSMQQYLQSGGTIREVKNRLDSLGLKVEDCIAFNEWIVDDAGRRQTGLDSMKKDMALLAELDCHRMAATGKGTTAADVPDKDVIAERYHAILEMGAQFKVVPQLEMWGFQRNLQDVADVIYIAMKSRHLAARVLLDVFHLYRGHTSIETLSLVAPDAVEMFHMNDIPPGFDWQTVTDADRIYPGDGIAPIKQTLRILLNDRTTPLVLSTELFNKEYYKQDALVVAKTSLAKMKAIVNSL
jgi:2-keto-myo-inositol isomerase